MVGEKEGGNERRGDIKTDRQSDRKSDREGKETHRKRETNLV